MLEIKRRLRGHRLIDPVNPLRSRLLLQLLHTSLGQLPRRLVSLGPLELSPTASIAWLIIGPCSSRRRRWRSWRCLCSCLQRLQRCPLLLLPPLHVLLVGNFFGLLGCLPPLLAVHVSSFSNQKKASESSSLEQPEKSQRVQQP